MSDTDSEMMRRQQDKDVRATIAPDETQAAPDAADADASSGEAREAAKAGEARYGDGQQEAILKSNQRFGENRRFEEPAEDDVEDAVFGTAATGGVSLVQPGRSHLKR